MKTCQKCGERFEDSMGFCPHDGEVLTKDNAGLVGRTLDNQYQIDKFIAAGGMGAVYRARHILLGDVVAIKILSPEMSGNAEWLKRFQREGQVARKFRHPNSVLVHDLRSSADGVVYMVMEYVEGRTLDDILRERGRFSPPEALAVLDPVASVLDAAHRMNVVHRDLKPENVMIGEGTVKLLDLGIAKMREIAEGGGAAVTSLTVAGQILGTPYYMSPEQWGEIPHDGNPDIDGRADIYSLGVMLYELLSGGKPFGGQTIAELRRGHVSFAAPQLHQVVAGTPQALSEVVARAMSKDRRDRPPTAGQFLEEVRAALGAGATLGRTDASPSFETRGLPASKGDDARQVGGPATQVFDQPQPTGVDVSAPTVVGSAPPTPPAGARPTINSAEEHPAPSATSPNANSPARHYAPSPTMASRGGASPTEEQSASAAVVDAAAPPRSTPTSETRAAVPAPMSVPSVVAASNATPAASAAATAPPRSRRAPMLAIVGGLLLLFLATLGAGGWYAWTKLRPNDNRGTSNSSQNGSVTINNPGGETGTTTTNGIVAPPIENTSTEMMRWWVDVAPQDGPDSAAERRAAPTVNVDEKQKFRFNFSPRESGYLYILGPNEKGELATFLTAKPNADSGVSTNKVVKDQVFRLNWLAAGTKPERYQVVFSPTALSAPGFLAAAALRPLSAAEQSQWGEFLQKAKRPEVAVKQEAGPSVIVSTPRSSAGNNESAEPLIFEIVVDGQ